MRLAGIKSTPIPLLNRIKQNEKHLGKRVGSKDPGWNMDENAILSEQVNYQKKGNLLGMQIILYLIHANKIIAKHFNVFLSCYRQAKSF